MTVKFYNRIEIAFWDVVIEHLGESEPLRDLVRRGYRVIRDTETLKMLLSLSVIAVAGFLTGVVLFVAVQLFS